MVPDYDAIYKIIQEVEPYAVELGWYPNLPATESYNVWQPWLRNNYGTDNAGYRSKMTNLMYAWLDLDLKEKMTGRR